MNPLLIILILIGGCTLWLLCSSAFVPLGKLFTKLFKDAKDAMQDKESEDNEE